MFRQQRSLLVVTILSVFIGMALLFPMVIDAGKPVKPGQLENIPIWQITQGGTANTVSWIDYEPNPRFATYDPDTPEDETDDAVLDKETGLVWQKYLGHFMDWTSAIGHCYDLTIGGRKGWRVPNMVELSSLVDPNQEYPALPASHPFSNLQTFYWSATTNAEYATHAWYVHFYLGSTNFREKTYNAYVWCVRGGQ